MRIWQAATVFSALSLAALADQTPRTTHIHVTDEMLGAGQVSSGVTLPAPPAATGTAEKPVASWGKPLPYPIVIADRRNNRLIEIAPSKQVIWEFPSPSLLFYRGNDDVFFSPDGNKLMVNEEDNYDIHMVDYASRNLVWSYGQPDTKGKGAAHFNYPDDAHLLADGTVATDDIRNCRIEFINSVTDKVIDTWGQPGTCRHDPPRFLAYPNGITPLPNGDMLITEIPDSWITRLTREGKVVWSVKAPHIAYPSDAYLTQDGQVIVSDYVKPGGVVIFDPVTRKVTWEYRPKSGEAVLDHPSLAEELPTGDVILNDDRRDRVQVIDRATKQVTWQYGVNDTPGHTPGLLFGPDGLDMDFYHDWKTALGAK